MKKLLLGGLLVGTNASSTWAQNWAGTLPVDLEDSLIVFRGQWNVPGASAAVLHRRATAHMEQIAPGKWVDLSNDTTVAIVGYGGKYFIHYRLIINSTADRYFYTLVNLAYRERAGEGFAAHQIRPIYKLKPRGSKIAGDKENLNHRMAAVASPHSFQC